MIRTAFILLAISVGLGAFGAHALKELIQLERIQIWNTGVHYQTIHALGVLLLSLLSEKTFIRKDRIQKAQVFLIAGIILFSGSLYFLSTKELFGVELKWLGPITPMGGLCFIIGWVLAAFSVVRPK